MKNLNIRHNMAMEFMTTIMRCASSKKFTAYIDENRFKQNNDIKKIIDEIHDSMSVFTESDLSILIKNFPINFYYPVMLIAHYELSDIEVFLNYFRKLNIYEYVRTCFDLSAVNVTMESNDKDILKKVTEKYSIQEANMFLEFKKNPEMMKSKLDNLFTLFYEKHFKQYIPIINDGVSNKINEHQEKLERNSEYFLKVIGNGDYSEALKDKYNFKIYLCYLEEFVPRYLTYKNTHMLVYGFSEEQKFKKEIGNEHSLEILKVLADETRLEILRLLCQKSWPRNKLVKQLGLTSATMTYQLNKLIQMDLVKVVVSESGKKAQYKARKDQIKQLIEHVTKDILGED